MPSMSQTPQHNLPRRRKRFIGRSRELGRLDEMLGEAPLVTIVGTGGMGKTRLAMHYGATTERFERVVLSKLANARTLDSFINAVAETLELPPDPSNGAGGGRLGRLGKAMAELGEVLLIVDNLEQVVDPAAHAIRRWLEVVPNMTFLVTSREPLHLRGERQFRLSPLPEAEAIELFAHRAQQVRPEFVLDEANRAEVAAIVRHLDAVPLAVELAAARINVFAAADILERLTRRGGGLDTLIRKTRHATVRHQSMHATLYWSWELLDENEQKVLAEASIFCGGFDLKAAEEVLSTDGSVWVGDVLESLVDKSLVAATRAAGAGRRPARRFALFETTREFASTMLSDEDRPALERRHARYYAQRLANAEELRRDQDLANIETAFWSSVGRDDALAAQLALGAYRMMKARSTPAAGRLEIVDAALDADIDDAKLRTELLDARATCLIAEGQYSDAIRDIDAGLSVADDASGTESVLLYRKALALRLLGKPASARPLLDDALAIAEARRDRRGVATIGEVGAMVDFELARFDASRAQLWEALQLARREGFSELETKILVHLALCQIPIGELEAAEGRLAEAKRTEYAQSSYKLRWLETNGWLQWYRGRNKRAFEAFQEALDHADEHFHDGQGIERHLNTIRFGLSALADDADDTPPLEHLRAIVQAVWSTEDVWARVQARTRIAIIHLRRGEFRDAVWLLRQASDEVDQLETRAIQAHVRCWAAVAEVAVGRRERAEDLLDEARAIFSDEGFRALGDDVAYFLRAGDHLTGAPSAEVDDIIEDLRDRAKERRFDPQARIWRWVCYDHLLELADLLEQTAEDAAAHDGLAVAHDGSTFVPPDGEPVDLSSRQALQLIVAELARRRSGGDPDGISVDELSSVGWPGEKLTKSAASSRVYTAIRTLRSMGLEGILLTGHDGYLLDADTPFRWLD